MTPWMALWILLRDLYVLDRLVSIVGFLGMCYIVWWKPSKQPRRRFSRVLKPIQIINLNVLRRGQRL